MSRSPGRWLLEPRTSNRSPVLPPLLREATAGGFTSTNGGGVNDGIGRLFEVTPRCAPLPIERDATLGALVIGRRFWAFATALGVEVRGAAGVVGRWATDGWLPIRGGIVERPLVTPREARLLG